MATVTQSAPYRAYEDFEPEFRWERDERTATLIVELSGFRREQMKVQVTSTPIVRIIGERPLTDIKWRRINKEVPIPSDCDANEVSAKFERGRLYVQFSIVTKPQETTKPPQETTKPPQETTKPQEAEETKAKSEVSEEKLETPAEKEKKKVSGGEGLVKRTKTRLLDYTISLRPTYSDEDFKKPKKLVNSILVVLFVVALGIYIRNAFTWFFEGSSKFGN